MPKNFIIHRDKQRFFIVYFYFSFPFLNFKERFEQLSINLLFFNHKYANH